MKDTGVWIRELLWAFLFLKLFIQLQESHRDPERESLTHRGESRGLDEPLFQFSRDERAPLKSQFLLSAPSFASGATMKTLLIVLVTAAVVSSGGYLAK